MVATVFIVVNFMLPSNLTQLKSCVLSNINFMSFKSIHFGRRPLQQDIHIFKYPSRTKLTCSLPKGCFIELIILVIFNEYVLWEYMSWCTFVLEPWHPNCSLFFPWETRLENLQNFQFYTCEDSYTC